MYSKKFRRGGERETKEVEPKVNKVSLSEKEINARKSLNLKPTHTKGNTFILPFVCYPYLFIDVLLDALD